MTSFDDVVNDWENKSFINGRFYPNSYLMQTVAVKKNLMNYIRELTETKIAIGDISIKCDDIIERLQKILDTEVPQVVKSN